VDLVICLIIFWALVLILFVVFIAVLLKQLGYA